MTRITATVALLCTLATSACREEPRAPVSEKIETATRSPKVLGPEDTLETRSAMSESPSDDSTFRIRPVRDIDEIRAGALRAAPPVESGAFMESNLVELVRLDSTIMLDVRYAGTNNFMGSRMYEEARAFLQRPAAEALVRVHRALADDGLGIVVYDGYRPWYVTKMFYEATPLSMRHFVANPESGSRHNRGCAVDIGLFDRATGEILSMPSGYDEFSERAYPGYSGGTREARANRALLIAAMEREDFTVNQYEWWHFDYVDWPDYRIQNVRFADIAGGAN